MLADLSQVTRAPSMPAVAAIIAASLLMAACAAPRAKIVLDENATATSCPPTCPPTVMVTIIKAGPGFAIAVSQDPIEFRTTGRGAIVWKIDDANSSSGWHFTNDGIEIRDPGGEFDNPRPGPQVFTWNNRNSKSGTNSYKYTIRVTDGTTTYALDPTI